MSALPTPNPTYDNTNHDYNYTPVPASKSGPYTTQSPEPRIFGRRAQVYRWICAYTAITTIPLALTTALLLYFVFENRVSSTESHVFLVDYDISAILTVSSWSATLAVLLPGFVMATYSYVVAGKVLRSSSKSPPVYNDLPTPHQYALSAAILEFGGLSSLWRFLSNVCRKSSAPLPTYLKRSTTVLIAALVFGWLITAADTWLHATSSTILSTELTETPASSVSSYGRRLNCSGPSGEPLADARGCTLNIGRTIFLMNDSKSIKTLINTSSEHQVYMVDNTAFLLSASLPQSIDFATSTFGIRTTCTPVSQACGLPTHKCTRCWEFDCSTAGFPLAKGDLYNANQRYFWAGDKARNKSAGFGAEINPFPFAAGMFQMPVAQELWGHLEIPSDQEKVALLFCEADILELEVASINGTLSITKSTISEDAELLKTITGTTAATSYWTDPLRQGFMAAGTETTIEAFVDSFAKSVSRTLVALVSGATIPVGNMVQKDRRNRLLSRIPMAPFWALILLSIGAVFMALIVATMALVKAVDDVKGVGQAKLRVSPEGLAALAFEDTRGARGVTEYRDFFDENLDNGARKKVVLTVNGAGGVDVLRHGL